MEVDKQLIQDLIELGLIERDDKEKIQGFRVSAMGILSKQLDKIIERLEKIDLKLYYLEKRDKERSEKSL